MQEKESGNIEQSEPLEMWRKRADENAFQGGALVKHLTIEINVIEGTGTAHVWRCAPAFGDSPEPCPCALQSGVLNDGTHRVKFGVYGAPIPLEDVKRIAREALTAKAE